MLTFGSLFAGMGGFDLGFERAGMQCLWQVEKKATCQAILSRNWPDAGRWDDVRTFPPAPIEDWLVDVICGGFPCQDISNVGKRAGIEGSRSGLWSQYVRIVRTLRPRIVVVENVAALLDRGIRRVLGDLASIRYDAEWDVLPAGLFGCPHLRRRLFLVAYPQGDAAKGAYLSRSGRSLPHVRIGKPRGGFGVDVPGSYWETDQPAFSEVDDGVSNWTSNVSALGNAVVPQVAEWIGRRIVERIGAA